MRKPVWPAEIVERAREMHSRGYGAKRIAHQLAVEMPSAPGICTVHGWIYSRKGRKDAPRFSRKEVNRAPPVYVWPDTVVERARELHQVARLGEVTISRVLAMEMSPPPTPNVVREWIRNRTRRQKQSQIQEAAAA